MILTKIGKDIISINEDNYLNGSNGKIHIIKLNFREPNKSKMMKVLEIYSKTNRFVISNNVKFYNSLLRNINKKYYVANTTKDNLISFFKRNNKVVLDVFKLPENQRYFLEDDVFFIDVLTNLEVIIIDKDLYERKEMIFNTWSGNLILSNGNDI